MPIFVLNPLASRRDFDALRQMQCQPSTVNVFRSCEELLAAVQGQTFAGSLGVGTPAEPITDPRFSPDVQRLRLDEIERQLLRLVQGLENERNRGDYIERRLVQAVASIEAHARHLAGHDASITGLRNTLAGISSIADQTRKDIADVRARQAAGTKMHTNGQVNGKLLGSGPSSGPGAGPLDVEKH